MAKTDVAKTAGTGRTKQRLRTRKDLLRATNRLLKQGRAPSLEEVADEALVSRATVYRYFPSMDALLIEAALDAAVPEASSLLDDDPSDDPALRLERVDTALHDMIVENETALRMMLAHSLQRRTGDADGKDVPVRQDRRTPLIEAALAPTRAHFNPDRFRMLKAALALVIGTEAMVVFRDVLQADDAEARQVKRWAIHALVEAAKKTSG